MTSRPMLWKFFTPAMTRAVPRLRPWMRDERSVPLKRIVYRCFTDPYTNLIDEPFEAVTDFGGVLYGKLSSLIHRRVFHFGSFEPNLTRWLASVLRQGDGFIDVGANVGYFSLLAARLCGEKAPIVAIEAAPSTFGALCENLRRNDARAVRAVEAAAYDREATLPIYFAPGEEFTAGASLVREVGPVEAEVRAAPLAMLLTQEEIERARIVKIDVEGAEVEAVRGFLPAVGHLRDDAEIVVEVFPQNADSVDAMLRAHGYLAYVLHNPIDPLVPGYASAVPERAVRSYAEYAAATSEEVLYLVFSRRDVAKLDR